MNKPKTPGEPLRVSYSAVTAWRECEQKYTYSYVQRLRPKVDRSAPTLGRMLHRYLEVFMSGATGKSSKQAHRYHIMALEAVVSEYAVELQGMANTAAGIGEEELATELRKLVPVTKLLATAYFRNRGKVDFGEHKPIMIEEHVEMPVMEGIVLPSVIDLVTKGPDGRTYLWEHKSTKNIPKQGRRFQDLQTLLYAVILEERYGIHVDEIIWNYIRTKEPAVPDVLKDGTVTRRKNIDTLTEVYAQVLHEAGADSDEYEEVIERIKDEEQVRFFPRYTIPRFQVEDILLRDFTRSALDIQRAMSNEGFVPVRNIGQRCDWCEFSKLCEAAILGGDDSDVMRRMFRVNKEKDSSSNSNTEAPDEDELLAGILE